MAQKDTLEILRASPKPLRAVDVRKAASAKAGHEVSGGLIARDLKNLREAGLAEQLPDKTWRVAKKDAELEQARRELWSPPTGTLAASGSNPPPPKSDARPAPPGISNAAEFMERQGLRWVDPPRGVTKA